MKTIIELREEAIEKDINPECYLYQKLEKQKEELEIYKYQYNILIKKVDKAIEYIEKYEDNECIYKGMIKKHNNKDTLLNILRGEEK